MAVMVEMRVVRQRPMVVYEDSILLVICGRLYDLAVGSAIKY